MSVSLAFILEHCTELSHSRSEPLPRRTEQCAHGSLSRLEPGGSMGTSMGHVFDGRLCPRAGCRGHISIPNAGSLQSWVPLDSCFLPLPFSGPHGAAESHATAAPCSHGTGPAPVAWGSGYTLRSRATLCTSVQQGY